MTTGDRMLNDLPEILGDLAAGPYPDYVDDILARSVAKRQRPAWMFPERWIPMIDVPRLAAAPPLPWRALSLAAILVALLLAAVAILSIGSPDRLPEPFGLARNGLVAFDRDGDIFTADPVTGAATPIVTGPGRDASPRFSLDGRRIAFERRLDNGQSLIFTVRADGRELTLVTPVPVDLASADIARQWAMYQFSPGGQTLLIATSTSEGPGLTLAQTDGSGMRILDVGPSATEGSFRPPDGDEILFVARRDGARGLFVLELASGAIRTVVTVPGWFDLAGPSWSPDGSRIAYWTWSSTAKGMTARNHVTRADGTDDRTVAMPTGAVWDAHATWSNDGTRLFVARGFTSSFDDVRGAVLPADGTTTGVEVAPAGSVEITCCAAWIWSPDDRQLLGRPAGRGGPRTQVLLDASGGPVLSAPWVANGDPTWQRLAP